MSHEQHKAHETNAAKQAAADAKQDAADARADAKADAAEVKAKADAEAERLDGKASDAKAELVRQAEEQEQFRRDHPAKKPVKGSDVWVYINRAGAGDVTRHKGTVLEIKEAKGAPTTYEIKFEWTADETLIRDFDVQSDDRKLAPCFSLR